MNISLKVNNGFDDNAHIFLSHQFDNLLLDVREGFHRWGRFSSRNDALEEVCKFLLVQIKLVQKKKKSLGEFAGKINSREQADSFILYFNMEINESIPDSILNTLAIDEFRTRLEADDYKLLDDICHAFCRVEWSNINNVILLDLFNEAFGKFLTDSFSEEKQLGQYLTPVEVVRFIVKLAINNIPDDKLNILIDPDRCKDFGYVLDPSCGVGSFLIELIHQLLPVVISKHGEDNSIRWLKSMGDNVIIGLDKSTRMIKLAVTHFAAIGVDCKNIYSVNSLDVSGNLDLLDKKLNNNVSIILTNPPFGAEFRGKEIENYKIYAHWANKKPQKIDSELLFFEKYVDWLAIDGNCLVILPESVLTNKGIYHDIRSGMAKLIKLNRVISLPPETFSAAGTMAKTSIIDFNKAQTDKNEVYFSVCREIGFKVVTKGTHKKKIITNKNDLNQIVFEYNSKNPKIGKLVVFDYSHKRWDAAFHSFSSEKENNIHYESFGYIKLTDVAFLVNDRIDPRRSNGNFRYIEISDVDSSSCTVSSKIVSCFDAPSRARKLIRHGDVLASTVRPEQKKFGVVVNPLDNDAVCTTGFAVIRPTKIEPFLLAQLLKTNFVTDQLLRNNIGVAYPVVDESCFNEIILPINFEKVQRTNSIASDIFKMEIELNRKKSNLLCLLENVGKYDGKD